MTDVTVLNPCLEGEDWRAESRDGTPNNLGGRDEWLEIQDEGSSPCYKAADFLLCPEMGGRGLGYWVSVLAY